MFERVVELREDIKGEDSKSGNFLVRSLKLIID